MAKSAQQKLNEFLDESRETSDAVREMVNSSFDRYQSYSHAAGYMQVLVGELINQLPKSRRAEYREQLYRQAQKYKNEALIKTIKES